MFRPCSVVWLLSELTGMSSGVFVTFVACDCQLIAGTNETATVRHF